MPINTLKASYSGTLTPAQAANGINAAIANVNRLTEDAKLLFEAQRYPTATSLAILAIEEYGKINILKEIARTENDSELRALWKDYRTHKKKNRAWIFPGLLGNGEDFSKVVTQVFDPNSEHPELLDHIKQLGFYTYCMDNQHWSYPGSRIDEKIARNFMELAEFFSKAAQATPEEIETWVKHFRGVSYQDASAFRTALCEYHSELQSRGLSSQKMDDFLNFLKKLCGTPNGNT